MVAEAEVVHRSVATRQVAGVEEVRGDGLNGDGSGEHMKRRRGVVLAVTDPARRREADSDGGWIRRPTTESRLVWLGRKRRGDKRKRR